VPRRRTSRSRSGPCSTSPTGCRARCSDCSAPRTGTRRPAGWFVLTQATMYIDHPQHAAQEHTLNIDFSNPAAGPAARVAVELTEESALALVAAIRAALAAAPPGLASVDGGR